MSYLDPPDARNVSPISEGVASVKDIHKELKKYGTPLPGQRFYELEPAKVLAVYLDENALISNKAVTVRDNKIYPDYSKYGWVKVRMAKKNSGISDQIEVRPLDSNIKEYPRPGEYVIVATYFDKKYYTQKLNLKNSVNLNKADRNHSLPMQPFHVDDEPRYQFVKNSNIRQIQAFEGDITFNGRFGQSIRFGSNITKVYKLEGESSEEIPDMGESDSPNIIIRAGQGDPSKLSEFKWKLDDFPNRPVFEDINNDDSSIWITTNQTVPLKEEVYGKLRNRFVPKLDGKQIILNSDRIVFNAKKSQVLISANEAVDISANQMISLQLNQDNVSDGLSPNNPAGKLKLGDLDATEPVLGGDHTMKLIASLMDIIKEFANNLIPATGITTFPGNGVPLSQVNIAAGALASALETLKGRLDEPKSRSVNVAHIIGPKVGGK